MNIFNLIKGYFISGEWRIAIRKRNEEGLYGVGFVTIPNSSKYWFADPLLFEEGGETFLFVEAFNRKTYKGDIGFFQIQDGKASEFELLIVNNFHMSYPLVFKYEDKFYMIPESEENSTVDLYVADDFPRGWRKDKTLISGVHYADTTLLELEGRRFLFTYCPEVESWKLLIYELNMKEKEVTLFQTIEYKENICRGAGKFYKDKEGRILRPVQDCRGGYGKGVLISEIMFDGKKFCERIVEEFDNSKLIVDGKFGADKFHTYSMTSNYEVIDYVHTKFDLFKIIKWKIRKYKRLLRSKSREKE